jgi:F-type H+-transporting ATPase subunit b
MQASDIISVNIWQIVVSLCNLLILFFILKKFLFKPVKKVLKSRQDKVDSQYSEAQMALDDAKSSKEELERRLNSAEIEADKILKEATENAEKRKEKIRSEAEKEAEEIIRHAKKEAELEKKKAESEIKEQIIDVSSALTSKLIERELTDEDHHKLIDSFISEMGDDEDEE